MQSGKQPVEIMPKRTRKGAAGSVRTGKRAQAGCKARGGEHVFSIEDVVPYFDAGTAMQRSELVV